MKVFYEGTYSYQLTVNKKQVGYLSAFKENFASIKDASAAIDNDAAFSKHVIFKPIIKEIRVFETLEEYEHARRRRRVAQAALAKLTPDELYQLKKIVAEEGE